MNTKIKAMVLSGVVFAVAISMAFSLGLGCGIGPGIMVVILSLVMTFSFCVWWIALLSEQTPRETLKQTLSLHSILIIPASLAIPIALILIDMPFAFSKRNLLGFAIIALAFFILDLKFFTPLYKKHSAISKFVMVCVTSLSIWWLGMSFYSVLACY